MPTGAASQPDRRRAAARRPAGQTDAGALDAQRTARVDRITQTLADSGWIATQALAADDDFERNPLTKATFFTAQRRLARRRELTDLLADASRGLVESYRALLQERQLWDTLARQDFDGTAFSVREQVLLFEGVHQHVLPMLEQLGYGDGPPPPEVWVSRIQEPLTMLAHGVTPAQAAGLAADAEFSLRALVDRLDRLVGVADEVHALEPEPEVTQTVKTRLGAALRVARDQVVPALVLCFAGTSAGVAATGDLGGAAAAGGAAVVAKGVELAAAARMARTAPPSLGLAQEDLQTGLNTLRACIASIGDPPREPHHAFLVRRAALQLVLDSARLEHPQAAEQWWDWAQEVETVVADPHFATAAADELCRTAYLLAKASA